MSASPAAFPMERGELVMTAFSGLTGFNVTVFDVRPPLGPLGANWLAPVFRDSSWTVGNLGEVFGVCLDNNDPPNIYVTSTSVYGTASFGPAASGGIYKIDGNTGAISIFATLPAGPASLGNICFDPAHQLFFVSHLDNGLVYLLDLNGNQVSAPFDHGVTGRPNEGLLPISDDGTTGLTARGRRIWGIQTHGNRLYYAVWNGDLSNANSGTFTNEIWSVGIKPDGTLNLGTISAGGPRLEISLPPVGNFPFWSSPVSDIAFSRTGNMLVAERTVFTSPDGTGYGGATANYAHRSRVLEFVAYGTVWVPSSSLYLVGSYSFGVSGGNAAGGADYQCDDTVYASGDALIHAGGLDIYGLQIFPPGGNTASTLISTSYLIDFDGDTTSAADKTHLGDVAVYREKCGCLSLTNCPRDKTVECGSVWDFNAPTNSFPGCDNYTISFTTVTNGTCPAVITRTWVASDSFGTTNTCSQTVTVVDTTPPILVCPSNKTVACGALWDFEPPIVVDACSGTNVVLSILATETNSLCPTVITRTWQAVDACGNRGTCSQAITIANPVTFFSATKNSDFSGDYTSPFGNGMIGLAIAYTFGNSFAQFLNPGPVSQFDALFPNANNSWASGGAQPLRVAGFGNFTISIDLSQLQNRTPGLVFGLYNINDIGTYSIAAFDANNVPIGPPFGWNLIGNDDDSLHPSAATHVSLDSNTGILSTQAYQPGFQSDAIFWNRIPANTATIVVTVVTGSVGIHVDGVSFYFAEPVPPTIACGTNKVVNCGTAWDFDVPQVTGSCDGANALVTVLSTITNTLSGGPVGGGGTQITRTWGIGDSCGYTNTCSQTVTVNHTPPSLLCTASKTVECGSAWSFDEPVVSSTCGPAEITLLVLGTVTNSVSPCSTSITRAWQAVDSFGNSATCSQSITVVDTTPPILVCPSNKTITCGALWEFEPPIVSDACSGTNVVLSVLATETNSVSPMVITRTWQAVDACGNTNTCSQTLTGNPTPPSLSCAASKTVECGTAWSFDEPAVLTACGSAEITLTVLGTVTNSVSPCSTSITRTWQAVDSFGNSATCRQSIAVVDTTSPTLACAASKTVDSGIAWDFDVPSATDRCSGKVDVSTLCTVTNGVCPAVITRIWEATDSCGNSALCSQTVTIRCSTNTCVDVPLGLALWLPFDETSSSVSRNLFIGGNDGLQMGNPVANNGYVAHSLSFDGDGQSVRVPNYPDINPGVGSLTMDAWVNYRSIGGDSARVIVDKRDPETSIGYSLAIISGRLRFEMTDTSGNTFDYQDTATVPADGVWHLVAVTVERGSANGGHFYIDGVASGSFDPTGCPLSLDNRADFVIGGTQLARDFPWKGAIDEVEMFGRALTGDEVSAIFAAGAAGKCKECATLQCPADLVLDCKDGSGALVHFPPAIASSACCPGPMTISYSPPAGLFPVGITRVTCTATDPCGNAAVCTFNVIVKCPDCVTLECPKDISTKCKDASGVSVDFPVPYATSACCPGPVTFQFAPPAGPFPVGVTTVTCTATDACGNTATCTFDVAVKCEDCLVLDCPGDVYVECKNNHGASVELPRPKIVRSCCPGVLTYEYSSSSGDLPIGVTPVTCTVSDGCGNHAECHFNVVVTGHDGLPRGEWAIASGGANAQVGNAIAVDGAGNSFVAGSFSTSATFGSTTLTSSGGKDAFLAKYDSSGAFQWVARMGGPRNDEALSVAVDASGDVFVVGRFNGEATFYSAGASAGATHVGAGGDDAFIAKYNASGNLIMLAEIGGHGADSATGVAVDGLGNAYVTGAYTSAAICHSAPWSITTMPLAGSGSQDCFVVRYSPTGVVEWADTTQGGGSYWAVGRGVAVNPSGTTVWVTGEFSGGPVFGASNPALATVGHANAFVARHGATIGSSWIWARQTSCGQVCGDHDGRSVGVDAQGNSYFTAYYNGSAMLGNLGPVNAANGLGLYDCLMGSFDFAGNPRWLVNGLGSSPTDQEPRGLVASAGGDVYVTGFLNGTGGLYAAAGQSVWLSCYDSAGTLIWSEQAVGNVGQQNAGWGVALDAAGCVYFTGAFSDPSLNFSGFAPPLSLAVTGGSSDLFVAKYCPQCESTTPPIVIVDQPRSMLVAVGSSASFSVKAVGDLPVTYRWRFNGTDILGATNSSFTVTRVGEDVAGIYDVVISNATVSTTSEPALLMIQGSFFIKSMEGGLVRIGWPDGQSWILQEAPSLTGPWTDSPKQANPREIPPDAIQRFYRLRKS